MDFQLDPETLKQRALNSTRLDEFADDVIPAFMDILQADAGSLLVGDENLLEVHSSFGLKTSRGDRAQIPFGVGITGQAAETETVQWVPDVTETENHIEGIPGAKWEFAVPLTHPEESLLVVADFESSYPDRPDDETRRTLVEHLNNVKNPLVNLAQNHRLRRHHNQDSISSLLSPDRFFEAIKSKIEEPSEPTGAVCVAKLEPRLEDPDIHTFRDLKSEITSLGSRLKSLFSDESLITRLYGNLFALYVPNPVTDRYEEKLRNVLNQICNPRELNVIALSRAESGGEELLNEAFLEVHFTKRRGSATSVNLHDVLRTGQISLAKQPIVQNDDGEVIGHEILVRGPEDTPLHSPGRLFESAYQEDRVVELDTLIVRRALRSPLIDDPGSIFLNVERRSIDDPEWRDTLKDLIHGTRGNVDVCLEITEHGSLRELKGSLKKLRQELEDSVRYAIDDFGTGSSNIESTLDLDPDILKVDRSLVRNVDEEFPKRSFLESLVTFSETNGTRLLTEGIESEDEWAVLKELNVDLAQGYYFDRPQPLNVSPTPSSSQTGS